MRHPAGVQIRHPGVQRCLAGEQDPVGSYDEWMGGWHLGAAGLAGIRKQQADYFVCHTRPGLTCCGAPPAKPSRLSSFFSAKSEMKWIKRGVRITVKETWSRRHAV